jgi:CBS domain containing-hemolysin-like protein
MREHRCHHVPVVERGIVVGMLGRLDLLKALVLRPALGEPDAQILRRSPLKTGHVADVMRSNVKVLRDTSKLLDAAHAFRDGGFHALPVVAADGRLVGIVTSTDVIQELADDLERPEVPHADGGEPTGASTNPGDTHLRELRDMYRAVRNYLQSGRAEAEHTRLVKAAERTREALRAASVDL